MTINTRIHNAKQNPQPETAKTPANNSGYCPSVPISVYRELAGELQTTQSQLDSVKSQNQRLLKQNQQLRQEIQTLINCVQHTQQVVYAFDSVNFSEIPSPQPPIPQFKPEPPEPVEMEVENLLQIETETQEQTPPPPPVEEPELKKKAKAETPKKPKAEAKKKKDSQASKKENSSDVNGWLLGVAILLIVLTAFGTGFLIVRPLLNSSDETLTVPTPPSE